MFTSLCLTGALRVSTERGENECIQPLEFYGDARMTSSRARKQWKYTTCPYIFTFYTRYVVPGYVTLPVGVIIYEWQAHASVYKERPRDYRDLGVFCWPAFREDPLYLFGVTFVQQAYGMTSSHNICPPFFEFGVFIGVPGIHSTYSKLFLWRPSSRAPFWQTIIVNRRRVL